MYVFVETVIYEAKSFGRLLRMSNRQINLQGFMARKDSKKSVHSNKVELKHERTNTMSFYIVFRLGEENEDAKKKSCCGGDKKKKKKIRDG